METTANRRSPFASAVISIQRSARRIEQAVDDGALDSTADGIEPITEKEIEDARLAHEARHP